MKFSIRNLLSTIATIFFLLLAVSSSDDVQTEKEVAVSEANNPPINVSPRDLYADYEANEVAADLKYKDKVLVVRGVVDNIGKDITDDIYVTLKTGEMFGSIQCFFADSHVNEAASLAKGQTITIKGKCSGKMMNVLLNGCSIQ